MSIRILISLISLVLALSPVVSAIQTETVPATSEPRVPTAGPRTQVAATRATAEVFLTVGEALELAFPDCEIEKQTVYLTEEQRARVERLLGDDLPTGIARPYVARRVVEGSRTPEVVGYAWFDTHRVRTHRESVMFAVDPLGEVVRIELLSFGEPPNYIPIDRWYAQFVGATFGDELRVGGRIRPITGATLTVHATTDAARRVLAIQRILFPAPAPTPVPTPESLPTVRRV
ncbi:MAG: FMN-binding protein [Planctomycetota bacterium]